MIKTLSSLIDDKIDKINDETGIQIIDKIKNIDIANIPHDRYCGVYVIIAKKGDSYIGSSIDIFERLRAHILEGDLFRKNLQKIGCINVYITKNEYDARTVESILLEDIKPKLNILKGPGSRKKEKKKLTGIWRKQK